MRIKLLLAVILALLLLSGCMWKPVEAKEVEGMMTLFVPAETMASESPAFSEDFESAEDELPEKYMIEGFEAISQLPELPSGCEITALAQTLRFLGYEISKTDLADQYLPKVDYRQGDFIDAFVGDPYSASGYGCYAPAIITAAENYLSDTKGSHYAKDLSGSEPGDLYNLVSQGIPVIVWATGGMIEPYPEKIMNQNGEEVTFMVHEHCMTLIGYDFTKGTVTVADPLAGKIVDYDMELFELRYSQIGSYSAVLLPNE